MTLSLILFTILPALAGGTPQPAAPVPGQGDPPVGVVSHRAGFSIEPLSRVYECADTMTVRYPAERSDSAFFRFHPAHVPVRFTVDGRDAEYRFEAGNFRWKRRSDDTTAAVVIEYRGRLDFRSEYSQVGPDRAVLRAEEIFPWGEGGIRTGRLAVTVPSGWDVIAPGSRLTPPGVSPAGTAAATRTEVFEWRTPIPSIGWICAGTYDVARDPAGGRTVSLYRIPRVPPDTASDSARGASIIALCDSLLQFYGSAFVPYRYDRLDVVEVEDWVAGPSVLAIAAPSFIMVKRTAFETDDRYNRVETILPHEVAHQWWMGTVFPEPRASALLSEGLCEYSSVLFAGASGRAGSRDTLARSPLLRPLISKVKRGAAVPLDTAVDIRALLTQYLKAAYVHHMLRGEIGDGPFRRLLALFAERYQGRSAAIADYRAHAGEVSGRDLGWFFDQWVSGTGLPALRVYNARSGKNAGGWRVAGRLRVSGYDRYTASVTLEARTKGGPARTTVRIGLDSAGAYRNDVPFAIDCPGEPTSVAADPDGGLLLIRKLPQKLSDLRDPGDALMVVGGGELGSLYRRLASDDSALMVREGWDVRIAADTGVTLGDLQRERLILYGRRGDNRVAGELTGASLTTVRGDSAVIGGETVRDSTLGLLQACVNPWYDDGLLVWVQPFGAAARPELRLYDDSWALVRGREKITSGTWEVSDEAMVTAVMPEP
jgi:hypothetical protein